MGKVERSEVGLGKDYKVLCWPLEGLWLLLWVKLGTIVVEQWSDTMQTGK